MLICLYTYMMHVWSNKGKVARCLCIMCNNNVIFFIDNCNFFIFGNIFPLLFDVIKNLKWCLTIVSILLKIRFGHAQISLPKIGIQMAKAACINIWLGLQNIWQLSNR